MRAIKREREIREMRKREIRKGGGKEEWTVKKEGRKERWIR